MKTGSATQVGTRHAGNEDRATVIDDLFESLPADATPYVGPANDKISIFGVFDGHGGDLASDWANKKLHKYFASLLRQGNYADAIPVALGQAFAQCEKEFCDWSAANNDTSGSCATMAVVRGNQVFVANAGDSKCVVRSEDSLALVGACVYARCCSWGGGEVGEGAEEQHAFAISLIASECYHKLRPQQNMVSCVSSI